MIYNLSLIPLSGKPEEKENTETSKTSNNLMNLQNHPSEMLVRTIEESLEKVLLQFLPKSEGPILSPDLLDPIDNANKNDQDSTADACQEENETLVKEDSVTVTIHENTNDQIEAEKIVEIQVHKEETDETEMMPLI